MIFEKPQDFIYLPWSEFENTLNVTNSHLFSDHLKRSRSFDHSDSGSWDGNELLNRLQMMNANRSTGARCVPRGSSLISFRNSARWEGERIYGDRYGPLRIVRLGSLNFTGNNTQRYIPQVQQSPHSSVVMFHDENENF